VIYSLTDAGRGAQQDKRSARTEQLVKALTDAFTDEELRTLQAAAPLIERLGHSI
jgi:DNA-binding MarR family transcriptional regulator